MNYTVYLIKGNTAEGAVFLYSFEQKPNLRPHIGDTLIRPFGLTAYKIIRDEGLSTENVVVRFTSNEDRRVTGDGDVRVTQYGVSPLETSHSYYVTPANNPNRISSYITSGFANDQTLKQLFR